ncbi:hypothetical protein QTO34_005741 [Cnephaeus nilssonii]|uniref:Uncharacterized protein n=1 Tax=Cnephaeus nilssonii TaxID=3371016 RepID=A0AA40LIY7_CNENI|nr:hypothetical protein QTO34_005741 [Eptesicus nilssonii]
METETEDERSARHPTLASSWDAACGALGRSLRVRRAQDSDWDELLAPPSSGCAGPAGTGGGSVRTLRGGGVRGLGAERGRASGPGVREPSWGRAVREPGKTREGWGRGGRAGRLRAGRRARGGGPGLGVPDAPALGPRVSPAGPCAPRPPPLAPNGQNPPVAQEAEKGSQPSGIGLLICRDLVSLKRSRKSPDEEPCFLSLSCGPSGGEEVVSVGILSSARNMEVYLGEEYCGTSRGRSVGNVLDSRFVPHACAAFSEGGFLARPLASLTLASDFSGEQPWEFRPGAPGDSLGQPCCLSNWNLTLLLSFGEKPCVFVSKVVAHVRPVPAKSPTSCPALGSRVDLERVHTMVAAMGSTLSPGAQQLMSLVRFQQQRCIPLGEQLQAVLGSAACKRVLGLRASAAPSGACDRPTCAPAPLRAGLTSGRGTEDVKAPRDESAQPPGGGHPAPLGGWDIAPQSHPLPGRDLQLSASFLPKRASDSPGAPAPELLPILQDVCGQVRRLRGAQSAAWPGHVPTPSEGGVGAGMGEPACSYLEKILSKKLELMERRLTDYLDERLRALQEHIDGKVALLARSLQSPGSPPPGCRSHTVTLGTDSPTERDRRSAGAVHADIYDLFITTQPKAQSKCFCH